jgi:hypothetical protein
MSPKRQSKLGFLQLLALLTAAVLSACSESRGPAGGAPRERAEAVLPTAAIPQESPLSSQLESVPDIQVETIVGRLPRLPYVIPAVYRNKAKGPDVRVIWPSPKDNSQVLETGTYTVTGSVPGTELRPRALVTVKATPTDLPVPTPRVESFPLGQVVLDQDTRGRDTQFIRSRDKFIRGLAASNPDSFLYNFRDAFGQPQPEGARQLGVWDSQTTRLRGHATGHYLYLSAVAQAYAGTVYDEALRENFLQKWIGSERHDGCKPSIPRGNLERETGIEPATSSLGSWHSTAELLPLDFNQGVRPTESSGTRRCPKTNLDHSRSSDARSSGRL